MIPYTVDENGRFTEQAPGFTGKRVLTDKGEKGDANEAVIKALIEAGMLIARGRLKHQYPHSWRSKKPVIFRNTPQWFIAMDKPIATTGDGEPATRCATARSQPSPKPAGCRRRARTASTAWSMSKPDWVISRQRAWGVPITVFVREKGDGSVEILNDERVNKRIADAFEQEGADAWYATGAAARFLKPDYDSNEWQKVDDVLDVWFDSGSTHAFVLEDPQHFPSLAGIKRKQDGGDRHRDVSRRLRPAPRLVPVLAAGELRHARPRALRRRAHPRLRARRERAQDGEVARQRDRAAGRDQAVGRRHSADVGVRLRLWRRSAHRAGGAQDHVETYRKLRNTIRWMLGSLAHFHEDDRVALAHMPELERLMLHRLAELDPLVRRAYADFDYKRIFAALSHFMTVDLSAFYFDIRKDALYCDPISSNTRRACLTVLDHLFRATVTWLAPMLPFTAEEAWLARHPSTDGSVHLELFPAVPAEWRNDALAEKWRKVRTVRRVVTGAIEIERAGKRIGSSLEADPFVYVSDPDLFAALAGVDLAEVGITSAATLVEGEGPPEAFRLDDVRGVAVEVGLARGTKCARSWKILPSVGSDPAYPEVSPRDAQALREWDRMRSRAAE